jgi:hypothetical protein
MGELVTDLMMAAAVTVVIIVWEWRYVSLKKTQSKHWEKIIDLAQTTDRRIVKFQQREVEVDNLLNAQTELIRSVVTNRQRTEEKIKLLDKQIDETVKLLAGITNVVETISNKTKFHETRIGQLENTTQEYFTYPEWKEMIAKEKERIKAETQDYPPGTTVQGEEGGVNYTTHKYDGKEITIINNPEWNKPDVPNSKEAGPFPDVDSIL